MALKAIIHKASVSFSDLDRNVYADHEITIARHPSETEERMMVRLLAFVLDVASGRVRTNNERHGYREIAIWKDGVTL